MIPTTTRWAQDLDREQVRMGWFVTGASQTCAKVAIKGEIGWLPVKAKVAIAKLVYGRRYQWEVEEGWGKDVLVRCPGLGERRSPHGGGR